MEATIKNMMSSQFRDAEEYTYHLEQAKNYMENQIVYESRQEDLSRSMPDALNRNTKEKKYVLSLHKVHATSFPEEDLEEKMIRWIKHEKVRDDPEEVFFDYRIVKVVRVTTEQQYGLDFLQHIIVMRENDKPDSFFEVDFKYLNKNNIEDIYLCLNNKVNYRENKLLNTLHTFIRSCVLGESS
ncbi:hypothetical protein Tco_0532390 [Tanacetum coccineum]